MRRDPDATRLAVGARIRALRARHGLTLRDVEARSGFSATHVSEIERGRTSPTIPVLVGIADALGVDPNVLVTEAEESTTSVRHRSMSGIDAGAGVEVVPLSTGIAGGRLRPLLVVVGPDESASLPVAGGEVAGLVQEGEVTLDVGSERVSLVPGDGFQLAGESRIMVRGGDRGARIVVVAKPSSLAGL